MKSIENYLIAEKAAILQFFQKDCIDDIDDVYSKKRISEIDRMLSNKNFDNIKYYTPMVNVKNIRMCDEISEEMWLLTYFFYDSIENLVEEIKFDGMYIGEINPNTFDIEEVFSYDGEDLKNEQFY